MKPAICLSILLLINAQYGWAQDINGQVKGIFSAQFLLSTGGESINLHLVGGGFKYSRGYHSIAAALMPTMRFPFEREVDAEGVKEPFVRPGFSAGPLYQYKRFLFAVPFTFTGVWKMNVGAGVRIGP